MELNCIVGIPEHNSRCIPPFPPTTLSLQMASATDTVIWGYPFAGRGHPWGLSC